MHFRLDLNTADNPVLIQQIMAAVEAVKRPTVLTLDEFDFMTILFADNDRVDGPKVEVFCDSLIKDLVEATYNFGPSVDPHLYELTQGLADCRAIYIVRHGEKLTIRGSSYDHAFDEAWQDHRTVIEHFPKAQDALSRFDETGTATKPYIDTFA